MTPWRSAIRPASSTCSLPSKKQAFRRWFTHAGANPPQRRDLPRNITSILSQSRILSEKEAKAATEAAASAPTPAPVPSIDNARPLEEVAFAAMLPLRRFRDLENLASNAPPAPLNALSRRPFRRSSSPRPSAFPKRPPSLWQALLPVSPPSASMPASSMCPWLRSTKRACRLTDLKPDDLEVFDNGVKVDVRSFVQAQLGCPGQSAATRHPPAANPAGILQPRNRCRQNRRP